MVNTSKDKHATTKKIIRIMLIHHRHAFKHPNMTLTTPVEANLHGTHRRGRINCHTAGPQDTRAWSSPAGTQAAKAAGRIHTDSEHGFSRAEVLDWQELLDAGSHVEAKKRGVLRIEGKTYAVRDGDVINDLFNNSSSRTAQRCRADAPRSRG